MRLVVYVLLVAAIALVVFTVSGLAKRRIEEVTMLFPEFTAE